MVTTRDVMEAGTAPGRSDIVAALDVGLQTSLTASGVPPGTYYVRVRAGNYTGLSAPSNEVAVTVP
ncbi:MAG: fibronectin type III domain-containing protein [Vicinamibacterales bacterium]